MAKVAEEAGIAREALYRSLSEEGNPRLETLTGILKALGLRIIVTTTGSAPREASYKGPSAQLINQQDKPLLNPMERFFSSRFQKPFIPGELVTNANN
jgi:transcriptional regulator with XRE-family HTH domain